MADRDSESWNFNVLLGQGTSVGSGYQLASARVVLPFLYMAAGAPVMFAGLLLPIVQVSKLISQIVATPFVSRSKRRKWYITLAFIAMAASLAIIALAADDARTELLAVIFLLVAASIGICQGLYSLAYQDLLGRVLPPPRRGSLLYTQATLAGLIAIAIAWGSPRVMPHMDPLQSHIMLLWAGIGATVLAGVLIAIILEPPTTAEAKSADAEPVDSEPQKGFFAELRDGFQTTIKEQWFRKFLVARALFLSIELAMPFYAVHAAVAHAHSTLR